ncbi:DUF3540 domain-containing protein [Taylorella equigenitalis]|uniref:Uncharacterized protein n=2 Tax=Taylorella equigenitalis TaxID=29575 RepID=A0A654KGZ2_TAYEM|nr:DUF3540 domain-containing protein [Taylorella equigenitalis]ADU91669.1 hypothetical protein TEQUI_0731 [Taylorella equigenitalis MCE9]ASY29905.1 hypothetical protein B9Z30_00525 [Taylorella equigenitalis]ASY37210.1 DUF3540 domain-containing protein [Taylorella equigenitalis]ASY40200.1 hypothetical protein CAV20_00525 [Taylorella equigenitalis]ASY41635.1 hypothetical protein CA943_00525 [Taylorella equigenitalis]
MNNTDKDTQFDVVDDQTDYSNSTLNSLILKNKNMLHERYLNTFSGVVFKILDEGYLVKTKYGEVLEVKKSFSCIISPNLNDVVLISGLVDESWYILSIINRSSHNKVKLDFGSDKVYLDKLLVNANEINLSLNNINITSESMNLVGSDLLFNSNNLKIGFNNSFVSGLNMEMNMSSLSKIVTGTDKVRALNIDYSADSMAKVSSNTTVIYGSELLKTDAKLIVSG